MCRCGPCLRRQGRGRPRSGVGSAALAQLHEGHLQLRLGVAQGGAVGAQPVLDRVEHGGQGIDGQRRLLELGRILAQVDASQLVEAAQVVQEHLGGRRRGQPGSGPRPSPAASPRAGLARRATGSPGRCRLRPPPRPAPRRTGRPGRSACRPRGGLPPARGGAPEPGWPLPPRSRLTGTSPPGVHRLMGQAPVLGVVDAGWCRVRPTALVLYAGYNSGKRGSPPPVHRMPHAAPSAPGRLVSRLLRPSAHGGCRHSDVRHRRSWWRTCPAHATERTCALMRSDRQ